MFFTCLCTSCKSIGDDPLPPDYRIKVDLKDTYNVNEDVTLNISIGIAKKYQERYSQTEDLKFELGYAPENLKEIEREKITILYTITDFSDDKYYYTKEENEIIYHFSENFVIPKEFFSETYFFCDSYGSFCIFLGIPWGDDWSFAMHRIYFYEKQGDILVIQGEEAYIPKDYRLKVDLVESYNLNETIRLTISIGLHQRLQEIFIRNGNYKIGLAYAPREYNNVSSKDQVTLYTIVDFSNSKYFYTKEKDEIIYHFSN